MLPILFSVGSFKLYTLGFLLAIGFFLFAFLSWRRLRELGINEEKTVDFLILSSFLGLILARLGFVFSHFQDFGFRVDRWLFWGRFPGLSFWGFLLGFLLALIWFCRKNRWDFWQVGDELIYGLLPFCFLFQIGLFFDGSLLGTVTSLPWGIFFPGDFIRRQPVALFLALAFFLIWVLILRIERSWRTWTWWKSKKTGLISLVFGFLICLSGLSLAFLETGSLYYKGLKQGSLFLGLILVLGLAYWRSGARVKTGKPKGKKGEKNEDKTNQVSS